MLPDIHRATQKFYIFLIVYLTGCTPFYLLRASPLLRKSELFLPFDCVIIKEIMPIGE